MEDNNIRIQKARKAFISTPDVTTVLKHIERCRKYSDLQSEPSCMMVYGASGVGKTSIIKKYLKQNQGDSTTEGDTVPVLYIELPENAKPVDAAREMLLKLNDPLALYESDITVLTKRIIDLVPLLKIELIIIDEFQHLVEKSSNKILARVGDWIKMLINKTRCPVILFGMPYSQVVLSANSQLRGRFSIQFHLRPFSYANDRDTFEEFLTRLDEALPFEKCSGLNTKNMVKKLYAFSEGNMRSLRNLIYHAAVQAIESDQTSIQAKDFLYASRLTSGDKQTTWKNPFEPSIKISKKMLADPPRNLGWEDYLRNNKKRGKPDDLSNLFD
ncbi:TniB family NTP-binding protein [Photobacterium sp. SDRW27]|uniref:TniB family NTP-binding protein n=1 Tax=Photobacterium obscurum TaxID=2829490 RepID=UPI0022438888|nr:TniB family NTP-binding protein [Photobacterium obscurum]MCW8330275.1 TniB family NTP-binding protein [Photobacterium obscurum]